MIAQPLGVGVCADVEKVVDMLKAEELPKKAVFCRCWRSAKVGLPRPPPVCIAAAAHHMLTLMC